MWSTFTGCDLPSQYRIYLPKMWSTFPICDLPSQNVIHLPRMWSTSPRCDLPSKDVIYLLKMWYTFPRCDLPSQDMIYLSRMWSTFPRYNILSKDVIYLPKMWSTSPRCDLPSQDVIYLHRMWSTFPECDLPSQDVIYLPRMWSTFPRCDTLQIFMNDLDIIIYIWTACNALLSDHILWNEGCEIHYLHQWSTENDKLTFIFSSIPDIITPLWKCSPNFTMEFNCRNHGLLFNVTWHKVGVWTKQTKCLDRGSLGHTVPTICGYLLSCLCTFKICFIPIYAFILSFSYF